MTIEPRTIQVMIPDCDTAEQLQEFLRLADKSFLSSATREVIHQVQKKLAYLTGDDNERD